MQLQVKLTVEIYKLGTFGERLISRTSTYPTDPRSNGYRIENYGTYTACKTNQITRYYGIAYAKAKISGKWQFASRTRSPGTISLRCGT